MTPVDGRLPVEAGISGGLTRGKKMTVTMRQMLEAGVHYGHQTRYWNPKMAPYIFGIRHKIHIINLEKTLPLYLDVLQFVADVASKRGKILFVGTKPAAREIIREEAQRCGMPYVDHRWLGGMLTNYKTIRQSIKRLRELEQMITDGSISKLIKKEALQVVREKEKLERDIGGIKDMGGIPDAIFIIDVGHEKIAIAEAKRLGIPVVGIVDTNNTPDNINYIIPGNDDSTKAIRLYTSGVADVILAARTAIAESEIGKEKETAEESSKTTGRRAAPKAEKKTTVIKKKGAPEVESEEAVMVAEEVVAEVAKPKTAAKTTAKKKAAVKKADTEK